MYIWLRGPIGVAIALVIAFFGFLLALGDLLDLYDALWRYTVPLTVVYAALIWRFALTPAGSEGPPKSAGALALYLALKLGMTLAVLLGTLGVIALGYDLFLLAMRNWHYIVITLGVLALIIGWAMLPERKKRGARPPIVSETSGRPERNDLVK